MWFQGFRLVLVSSIISAALSWAPADACGCQKRALQNMLKLQEEAAQMGLPSHLLRVQARALGAAGKHSEAQTTLLTACQTALSELKTAESNFKAGKTTFPSYRFALLHAAELQKERARTLSPNQNILACSLYEDALQLELKAGLSAEDTEYTYQTLITMLVQAKDYQRAEPYAQRLLAYRESTDGRFGPQVAQSLHTYALILRKVGRMDEAQQAEQRSRAIANGNRIIN